MFASVQNTLFPEAHSHDVVDEAGEPGVVEKPECREEEMTSPDLARMQVDRKAAMEVN